jgi:hypothetical protein
VSVIGTDGLRACAFGQRLAWAAHQLPGMRSATPTVVAIAAPRPCGERPDTPSAASGSAPTNLCRSTHTTPVSLIAQAHRSHLQRQDRWKVHWNTDGLRTQTLSFLQLALIRLPRYVSPQRSIDHALQHHGVGLVDPPEIMSDPEGRDKSEIPQVKPEMLIIGGPQIFE